MPEKKQIYRQVAVRVGDHKQSFSCTKFLLIGRETNRFHIFEGLLGSTSAVASRWSQCSCCAVNSWDTNLAHWGFLNYQSPHSEGGGMAYQSFVLWAPLVRFFRSACTVFLILVAAKQAPIGDCGCIDNPGIHCSRDGPREVAVHSSRPFPASPLSFLFRTSPTSIQEKYNNKQNLNNHVTSRFTPLLQCTPEINAGLLHANCKTGYKDRLLTCRIDY